jgi:hypothetical protein
MNIEELTIAQAREISRLFGSPQASQSHPYTIGSPYFIRTVTHHHTGRLVEVTEHELVLEDAAWIADSGRFADAIVSGSFSEVEPFPDGQVIIGRSAIIDAVKISTTPRSQK